MKSDTDVYDGEDGFDIEQVRLKNVDGLWGSSGLSADPTVRGNGQPANQAVKEKPEPYIRMIPMKWVEAALKLPHCAIEISLIIWYYHGLNRGKPIVMTPQKADKHGLNRNQVRRGLKHLEDAGLLKVARRGTKSPVVVPVAVNAHQRSQDAP